MRIAGKLLSCLGFLRLGTLALAAGLGALVLGGLLTDFAAVDLRALALVIGGEELAAPLANAQLAT